jgi:hypothetical protein
LPVEKTGMIEQQDHDLPLIDVTERLTEVGYPVCAKWLATLIRKGEGPPQTTEMRIRLAEATEWADNRSPKHESLRDTLDDRRLMADSSAMHIQRHHRRAWRQFCQRLRGQARHDRHHRHHSRRHRCQRLLRAQSFSHSRSLRRHALAPYGST